MLKTVPLSLQELWSQGICFDLLLSLHSSGIAEQISSKEDFNAPLVI